MTGPWSLRLFERVPLAPAWTGLMIAAAWFAVSLVYAYPVGWLEDPPGSSSVWWTFEIFWAVMIGYMPTATAYSLRGAAQDLQRLRPALRCSDAEFEDRQRELPHFDRGHLFSIGILGVAGGLLLPLAPGFWVEARPPLGDPNLTWVWMRNAVFVWLILRTLYIEIATARRFSQIGSRWTRVELLDLDPLAPFARRGLGSVLLLVGLAVLFSVQFAAPWKTGYLTVATQISFLAVAIAAMLLPVLGVQRKQRTVTPATREREFPPAARRPNKTRINRLTSQPNVVESPRRLPQRRPRPIWPAVVEGVGEM